VVDAVPDRRGDLRVGAFVIVRTDAPTAVIRAGLVLPPSGLAAADLVEVEAAAADLGWPVLSHESFVRGPVRFVAWKGEAALVAYDLDRVVGLLGRRTHPTRDGRGLSVALLTARRRRGGHSAGRRVAPDAHTPEVMLRAYDGRRQRARFTATADGTWHPSRLVDLVQLFHAQTGRYPRDPADLCCQVDVPPAPEGDDPGAVAGRTTALARCYARLFDRHRSLVGHLGGADQPASPGWYGRRWLEMTGLVPPLSRWWGDLDPRVLGALEAYHGPEVALLHRAEPVPDCYLLDVLSEFVLGAANVGVWDWLTAERLEVVPLDPGEVRERIAALGREALTDGAVRREFGGTFLRQISEADVLPHRVPEPDGSYHSKVGPLYCLEPSLWHAFDVVRSRIETGSGLGQIIEAWELRPVGRVRGLHPLSLPWGTFDPNAEGADLFRWLVESRVKLQAGEVDPGPAWTPEEAARTVKAAAVALVGSFAQVISTPSPGRVSVVLVGGDGRSEIRRSSRVETPGHWYFPPAAAAILAEGRLTGYAARELVSAHGGRPLYSATDSVIASGLTPEAALAVQRDFEHLNPTRLGGPRIVAGPEGLRQYPRHRDGSLVLRITGENFGEPRTDERGEPYLPRVPLTFTGWHTLRYVLTDPGGRPVHWSEHGLGELLEVLP